MIGDNLRKLREEQRLGVNELSRLAEVNASYISAIENGTKTNPSNTVLSKLAGVLKVDLADFYINEEIEDQSKFVESLQLDSPADAMKFILSQPSLMAYGGYDLNEMDEDELMDLANDMLFAMKLSLEKNKRK